MNKLFRAIAILGVFAALAQSAIALTSTQRDVYVAQMLANIGATVRPCGFIPDVGYGLVCANYSRSGVAFTRAWDLYSSSNTQVLVTAQRIVPWEVLGSSIRSTFVTADDDGYIVLFSELRDSNIVFVAWPLLPSDGASTRLGSLDKPSNAFAAQPVGTSPPISPASPASITPPNTQVIIPSTTPATSADLLTLEKYVQDNSLLYQGFVAGTTTQGAFTSSQNAFFLIALGEKLPESAITLKAADELQATLSLGTQTITLKKK